MYSKSVNSFCSNNKLSHLSSLLQYNYLTKINHLFLFAKIFFHRNSTTPSPIHFPSYAHAQCRNIGKSTPQAKTIFFVGLSLLISLWCHLSSTLKPCLWGQKPVVFAYPLHSFYFEISILRINSCSCL